MLRPAAALAALTVSLVGLAPLTAASAAVPAPYTNCTVLHKKWPHGIGRANAVDKVSGSGRPVTTFRKDTAGYSKAMTANRGLDRDKDGIACEQ